jgi:hypothetical protein
MMKKKIGVLSVVTFLLVAGNAFAAYSFDWMDLVSDNRSLTGWRLSTDFRLFEDPGPPEGDPPVPPFTTATYSWDNTNFNPMGFTTWGYDGYYEYWTDNVLDASGWANPTVAEGKTFTYRANDGGTTTLQAWGTVPVGGIKQIDLSYDLTVLSGGSNPTISWQNSDARVEQYQIRIIDEFNELLWQTSLGYVSYTAYTFSDFFFVPGVDYYIRIEARDYEDFLNPGGDLTRPDESPVWFQVMNRSAAFMPYTNTVPVPGAIWLLGSGLVGLVGFRRKFKK